jgi:hypothetical protein
MDALQELEAEGLVSLQYRSTSWLSVKAGDLVKFRYAVDPPGETRVGLVTRSKRTNNGYFLSTRANTLLNIYLLDSITNTMMYLIIKNLYRNRIACTYKNVPRKLSMFLGKNAFRTFNVAYIKNFNQVDIKKDKDSIRSW